MKKTDRPSSPNTHKTQPLEVLAFIAAAFYMQSVLTVAHHVAHWPHNGNVHVVESPAILLLVFSVVTVAYYWYQQRGSLKPLSIVTLTVLATASLFWLSGLRTNFYF